MAGMVIRRRLELSNAIRHSPTVQWLFASYLSARHLRGGRGTPTQAAWRIIELCRAARITPLATHRLALESQIRERMTALDVAAIDWDELLPKTDSNEVVKAIILKRPVSEREKGVLLVAFEDQWLRLLRHGRLDRLSRDYHLVLAPTWSPPHDLPMLLAVKMWPGQLFTLVSNFDDIPVFKRLVPPVIPVRLLASNWVHAGIFAPPDDRHKEHDIVMLANFAAYKRHFLLFQALRSAPRRLSVLLLGVPWENRQADSLRSEARLYGVEDLITIREALPQDELIAALQSARVSVITTGIEGSCLAITESLLADVPVGLFADARIGSKAFINEHTGRLFSHGDFAVEVADFVATAHRFRPRQWALDNGIDCKGSTLILNTSLREHLSCRGEVWTQDITVHHRRPTPMYLDPGDRELMRPHYERFPRKYGIGLLVKPS